ncbi:dihydropteroate synthase [Gracilibacillus sp. YIM 98692]|uniref:dihydropteroate synthase n=1 Tax=Gracilibacillus sp. YIM 98692 TaxID=2663532 RepID=UPI0013D6822F|nr:dihydropteroate synthase [Gracilibacillus sp. YIM 98692]
MSQWLKTKVKNYYYHDQTLVMGILNVTPDSFSDGGNYTTIEKAIQQAQQMQAQGAHIIDVGGESTRPGHEPVPEAEEIDRIKPVIKELSKHLSVPISIDTSKAAVAKAALEAGASIINDIWGAKKEPEIAKVAAQYDAPIILMHNRDNKEYQSLIDDVIKDLQESVDIALAAGVKHEHIILDPGVGFAKTYEDNLNVMRRLDKIKSLGYPILLGTSRKSFIGLTLDLPVDLRDEGTGATVCYGLMKGVEVVRVHNVEMTYRMTKMMDCLMEKGDQ